MKIDGDIIDCGFFKNEYVWASDKEQALSRAQAKVALRIKQDPQIVQNAKTNVNIELDEVESGMPWIKVFKSEGFVFHPIDEVDD